MSDSILPNFPEQNNQMAVALKADFLRAFNDIAICLQKLDEAEKLLLQAQFELDTKWWEAGKNDK